MTMKHDGGPAFPQMETEEDSFATIIHGGMSLRDWFASQSLALASADYDRGIPEYDLKAMFGGRNGLTRFEIVAAQALR